MTKVTWHLYVRNVVPMLHYSRKKNLKDGIGVIVRNAYHQDIKTRESKEYTFDAETFMPKKIMQIDLSVCCDAQHDGRLWHKSDVERAESELVTVIMEKLKLKVEEFVSKTKPFGIHE